MLSLPSWICFLPEDMSTLCAFNRGQAMCNRVGFNIKCWLKLLKSNECKNFVLGLGPATLGAMERAVFSAVPCRVAKRSLPLPLLPDGVNPSPLAYPYKNVKAHGTI